MPEKKVGKMAIFGPKPWVNPFEKMSIFRLFELLVQLLPRKAFFRFRTSLEKFSLPIVPKKIWKNGRFLDQNHGKNGKMLIFLLFELLVFIA